jgi:hypothetical protein
MGFGCILNEFRDFNERKTLVKWIKTGDDLEVRHEVMQVEWRSAVDAADKK